MNGAQSGKLREMKSTATVTATADKHTFSLAEMSRRIWAARRLITIEPLIICFILPSILLYGAVNNLHFEKACRINLGLDPFICVNMIDHTLLHIECPETYAGPNENVSDAKKENLYGVHIKWDEAPLHQVTEEICFAERESQKIIAKMNAYRSPIASAFSLIIILFAGGWSDKKQIRKPCIIIPMVGELLSCVALLLSAIFFDELPLEFGGILERVLPSLCGGLPLLVMGIFSYLTAITSEENRSFRFACFFIIMSVTPVIVTPLSGPVLKYFGYTYTILSGIVMFGIGILYGIFFIDEITPVLVEANQTAAPDQNNKNGIDNPTFSDDTGQGGASTGQVVEHGCMENARTQTEPLPKESFFREFFDPALAIDSVKVFFKTRPNNGKKMVMTLTVAYVCLTIPAVGEADYGYGYARRILNWNYDKFTYFTSFNTGITLIGTSLMMGVFSKILKMSDPMVGIISTFGSILSRFVFAFANTSFIFYAAAVFDMFTNTKVLVLKSILSRYVASSEIGRVYSVLGFADTIISFIFQTAYSQIYENTIDQFPGAILLFSTLFLIIAFVVLCIVYVLCKRISHYSEQNIQQNKVASLQTEKSAGDYLETSHV